VILVAIPLPITGAWSGSAAAYLLGIPFWRAFGLIALGILSGVFVAGAGYLKSVGKTNQDPFDKIKFLKTTVLGGIVGGVVPYTGLTADVVMIVLVNAGVVTLVETC